MDHAHRVHFVWTGRQFPYFCRLAIESAVVAMPDSAIDLHVFGTTPGGRHVAAVLGLPQVRLRYRPLTDVFEGCPGGASPYLDLVERAATAAARSNLVRLAVLHEFGGVYLDTDTVVLRALHHPSDHGDFVGAEEVWSVNRRRIDGHPQPGDSIRTAAFATDWVARRLDQHLVGGRLGIAPRPMPRHMSKLQVNNAVIGARPGSSFVARALETALTVDPAVRFALGPSLLDDVARAGRDVSVLPPSRFYAVPPSQSFRLFHDPTVVIPPDAMVLHTVASNHRRLLASLDEHDPRFERSDAPFWRAARLVRASIALRRRATSASAQVA